ncbi:UNVERIFIED_CONTAM: hypothetical protein Slati_1923400 [Sesamum latifolium]|uniref:Uncharacterized protein n=1 Tax=Sesamum latifolium TaxID=2727402 RepID=A0AAW2X1T4_9LAMI
MGRPGQDVILGIGQGSCPGGELLSRFLGELAQVQGDVHKKKLEDQVERLLGEVTKLRDTKNEAVGRYQQAEREVKKLQREVNALKEDHAEELQKLADQVRKEFPNTEEGQNCLEACWASRLAEYKKYEDYKKEVVLVAGPYLRFAFEAYRQQCIAQGYPPVGEDTSFLNFNLVLGTAPDPFARPTTTTETPPVESGRVLGIITFDLP